MTKRQPAERRSAEIEEATTGDAADASTPAGPEGELPGQLRRDVIAAGATDATAVPLSWREQLAHTARRISIEALSAELAAERGDWEALHATYERLALLFAEYRLLYVQCFAP